MKVDCGCWFCAPGSEKRRVLRDRIARREMPGSPQASRRAVDLAYDPDEVFEVVELVPDETEYETW